MADKKRVSHSAMFEVYHLKKENKNLKPILEVNVFQFSKGGFKPNHWFEHIKTCFNFNGF